MAKLLWLGQRREEEGKVGERTSEARIAKTAHGLQTAQPWIHGGPRTPQEAVPYAYKASLDFSSSG